MTTLTDQLANFAIELLEERDAIYSNTDDMDIAKQRIAERISELVEEYQDNIQYAVNKVLQ